MDFGTLLQTAKENDQGGKKEVRYYTTKFAPPKKEEKKARNLSANIQKFLARKEAEEKQKSQDAKKKREELLALRSQDKKATRRVNVMLKRTKSANQSVIEDAVDNDNTAVTLAGPSQPDEDDYGYVSQEAAAYYNKMMEKYNKMPDDPKFTSSKKKASQNLSTTKDRVKAALEREREEAMMPHRRKRKHKEEGEGDGQPSESHYDSDDQDKSEPPPKVKPKSSGGPPPLNFSELLKLAAQKQHEPIMIEVKPKEDEGPLFTKKQKREMEKERQRKEAKLQNTKIPPNKPTQPPENRQSSKLPPTVQQNHDKNKKIAVRPETDHQIFKSSDCRSNMKIPRTNIPNNLSRSNSYSSTNNNATNPKLPQTSQNMKAREGNLYPTKVHNGENNIAKSQSRDSNPKNFKPPLRPESSFNKMDSNKRKLYEEVPMKSQNVNMTSNKRLDSSKSLDRKSSIPKSALETTTSKPINKSITTTDSHKKDLKFNGSSRDLSSKSKPLPVNNARTRELPPSNFQPKKLPPADLKPKKFPPDDLKPKKFPPDDIRPKKFPPDDIRPKKFPPDDLRPKQFPPKDLKPKQFPPPDVRRKEFPPRDVKRKPLVNKRRILDDDDEYDSEMDDFIDDGPEEEEDYSKYIKDIFGYDKSKYRGLDEDDVDNMESTFAQQMKEDVRSTKIGIMEDLEDIKREREEKKRKAMMKKRK